MAYYVKSTSKKQCKTRNRSTKVSLRVLILILAVITIITSSCCWYYWRIRPVLLATAEANIKSHTTMAVNDAVMNVVSINTSYNNLVSIEKNANNDVVLMQANSSLINILARKTALLVQKRVSELEDVGVAIPIGTLSGIPFFTGKGSTVTIAVTPIGSVICAFESTFVSAGINQTLHQIYMQVDSKVDIIIPTMQKTIDCSTTVLLCETIIVGKIPETYLSGSFFANS